MATEAVVDNGAVGQEPVLSSLAEQGFVEIVPDKLWKRIIKEGEGDSPSTNAKVEVHYVGTLYPSGDKFDSSRDRGTSFDFKLGTGAVIKGWDTGVATMKIGEVAELLCGPEYAYGESGSPPKIPANATLKFEVELLDFGAEGVSSQEKLAQAQAGKAKGDDAFKAGDYPKASSLYAKASSALSDTWSFEDGDKEQAQTLLEAVELNGAATHIKLCEFREALKLVDKVLDKAPGNKKAVYRKVQCYLGIHEFDSALQWIQKGLEIDAGDATFKALEQQALAKKAQAVKQEKSLYAKMFA